jgi:peptidoglycan/xylan/chitin deacetylase (PgdA/CDA1 family)
MNYMKKVAYAVITLIGLIAIVGGLFPTLIENFLLPKRFILIDSNWVIIIGLIFVFIGLLLLNQKKYHLHGLEIFLVAILLCSAIFTIGWLYGQYEHTIVMSTENIEEMREQLRMIDNMKSDNPFYSKKIILRDDDVGNYSHIQSARWLSDLCIGKDIKVTYAVIPSEIISNPDTVAYLNSLNRTHFEFAVHGYEHISFEGLPYDEQYNLIENATDVFEEKLNYKPFTFVPPSGSGDINTTKACKFLGYHSITDVLRYPSYVTDFTSEFEWEESYNPISHHNFTDFENNFNRFYNSSNEYYMLYLHDWTFLDKQLRTDINKTREFEKAIDYMKKDNVQFFTIEEAYQWKVDEPNIKTLEIDKHNYVIDLSECRYNHTVMFRSPFNSTDSISVKDMNTNDKTTYYGNIYRLNGIEGHWYIFSI